MKLLHKIVSVIILVVISGCQAKLTANATSKRDGGSESSFKINSRAPLVVKAGDKLALTGEGFKPGMSLALAGNTVGSVEVQDSQNANWSAPAGLSGGVMGLTATQEGATQDISIIYQPGDGSIPVITKTAAEVCAPEQFYDAQGTLQSGRKVCTGTADETENLPACTEASAGPCIVDGTTFRAAKVEGLAGKLLSGTTAAGVSGTIANHGTWDLALAFPGSGHFSGVDNAPDMTKVLPSVTLLGSAGTMAERGTWDAVNNAFPGSGYFTGATLPPVGTVCSSGKTGGANGTATCQTGTPTGTDPAAGEILSGKSAWSSAGSVINGAMANRSGAWSLTSAWPGTGYFDTAPTFPDNKVCDDTSFLGTTGTADCSGGSYQDDMKSTAHRTVNANQVSLTTEISTGLSGDYRRVPDILLDDDGYHASSPVVKQTRPPANCGTTGTIEQRINDCNTTWSGKTNGTSGEGDWKLVTRIDTPAVYEVWRDERTGLIWSDRVGDSTSPIDPDTNDFTANWCQASGNAQANDPSNYCNNATYQNQTTAESWCGNEATGAPMKGNIGSTQNITWRLPTKYDWQIADANGIRFVLPNMVYSFWSASVVSYARYYAWQFYGDYGNVNFAGYRSSNNAVRCVGAR